MRQVIGLIMVILPFAVALIATTYKTAKDIGWPMTLAIGGIIVGLILWVTVGMIIITGTKLF